MEVAVKNTTIFVGTIIYQLHVSALIGHLQVGIERQSKISIISMGMGERDLVYKYMGFVQVREESPILYSHKTQLNMKLSLLQYYNMFRPKLSAIFRLYMKPI